MNKKIFFFVFLFSLLSVNAYAQTKKAVMVVAERNFRDEELFVPKGILERAGATYTGAEVERDENIVTGYGPGAAGVFGEELVKVIQGQ